MVSFIDSRGGEGGLAEELQGGTGNFRVMDTLSWSWWWFHGCRHMSELITLYTFIMCSSLCVTLHKVVFTKAVYMPSSRVFRLLGLEGKAVSISLKA